MTDLIKDLKNSAQWNDCEGCGNAVDEIERLHRDCEKVGEEASDLILENERLRRDLAEAQRQLTCDPDATICRLERELAEARGLLREARDAMGGKRELDGMREQIDAFLSAADSGDEANG